MRILVLGSRGQLGQAIAKQEYMYRDARLTFSYESFDITDFSLTKLKLKSERPNVIINAAAFTQVDLAEDLQVEANKVNFEAVDHLANLCLDLKCGLIHISTDYVFDGSLIRPYVETDSTNPKSSYGVSKLRGEEAIQKSGCCYVIIRSSWIFSEFGQNFLKTILRLGDTERELRVVGDQYGGPTYAPDLAMAIFQTLTLFDQGFPKELYHFTGDPYCSWYEFAVFILSEAKRQDEQKKTIGIKKVTSKEFVTKAARPKNSRLNSNKFKRRFGMISSDWRVGVKFALSEL